MAAGCIFCKLHSSHATRTATRTATANAARFSTRTSETPSERGMENDGFVMVQPRKKRGKSARESQKIRDARARMQQTEDNYQEEHGPDATQIAQTLRTCTAIVAKTSFAERVVGMVARWCTTGSVVAPSDPVDIVCFGIGRVRSSRTAQHQAGMLFAMMTHAGRCTHWGIWIRLNHVVCHSRRRHCLI